MTASPPDAGSPRPEAWVSAIAGFAVALVACGGILAERLSRGDVVIALVAQLFLTTAVLAVMRVEHIFRGALSARSPRVASKIAAQLLGAAAGILLAHAALRASRLGAVPWLSERPAQLVNDVVAVFAPLTVVWAATRRPPNTVVFVATLVVVTAYRATGFMWHVDGGVFSYTVQDFVTGEIAGSAVGVAAFRWLAGG